MRKKTKEDQILNLEGNRNTKNQKQIQWKGFLSGAHKSSSHSFKWKSYIKEIPKIS